MAEIQTPNSTSATPETGAGHRFTHLTAERMRGLSLGRWELDGPALKPQALWLSVNGGWEDWLAAGNQAHVAYRYSIEFEVNMDRILVISTADELDRFHAEFGVFCPLEQREMKLAMFGGAAAYVEGDAPDWGRVAAEYDGILIAPHMPDRSVEHPCSRWYQYWDAACCAVWDTNVLTVVRGSSKELAATEV